MIKLRLNLVLGIILQITMFVSDTYAATVKKIVKQKYAAIDSGKDDGFVKKAKVCVHDDSDKKIACGQVVLAKAKVSYIFVGKNNIKKIKKGMTVKLVDAKGKSTKSAEDTKSEEKDSIAPKGASNFKLAYILTPIAPAVFHAVSYSSPFDTDGTAQVVDTLWNREKKISSSIFGFGTELGFGVGASKLNVGARLRVYKSTTVKSNYDAVAENFADNNMSALALGTWVDYYPLIFDYGTLTLDLGTGLDMDLSQLSLTMDQKSDVNDVVNQYYKVNSNLTILSMRINAIFNLFFDPIGIQFGSFFTIPLTSSQSFSANVTDPQVETNLDPEITGEDDIKSAIDHKPAGLGVELFFSAYYAF